VYAYYCVQQERDAAIHGGKARNRRGWTAKLARCRCPDGFVWVMILCLRGCAWGTALFFQRSTCRGEGWTLVSFVSPFPPFFFVFFLFFFFSHSDALYSRDIRVSTLCRAGHDRFRACGVTLADECLCVGVRCWPLPIHCNGGCGVVILWRGQAADRDLPVFGAILWTRYIGSDLKAWGALMSLDRPLGRVLRGFSLIRAIFRRNDPIDEFLCIAASWRTPVCLLYRKRLVLGSFTVARR